MASSPFEASSTQAGHGKIHLASVPPTSQVLRDLSFQYPLKLIAPTVASDSRPPREDDAENRPVHRVFLLTYGGGIVAGDTIDLRVHLEAHTCLVLLTQGSTKVFKAPGRGLLSRQRMDVELEEDATFCYLPDPVQPFESSAFEQQQTYRLRDRHANLCVCDWVSEGRPARGEKWSFYRYFSRNEVWLQLAGDKQRLLLRDNIILENGQRSLNSVIDRMHGLGVFGTLILHGALFQSLGQFFTSEFKLLPRIGAKQWDNDQEEMELSDIEKWRLDRLTQEASDGVLWTAAETRGFVVVKFGAKEAEGGKRWLKAMLKYQGIVEQEMGEQALLCLR